MGVAGIGMVRWVLPGGGFRLLVVSMFGWVG